MTTWARFGGKCVAVRTITEAEDCGFAAPQKGCVYQIRDIEVGPHDHLYLRLKEITNDPAMDGEEPSWWIGCFRPAVPPRTQAEDTQMFLSLLKSVDPIDRAMMMLDEFQLP